MDTRAAISQLIFFSEPPKPVDIVMVLGSTSIANMDPAIELYRNSMVSKILISGMGPNNRGEPEWQIYRQYALDQGIPSSAMLVESQARNTRENFILSEILLSHEIGWSNIKTMAISTSPIHTRRALMTARRYFPPHLVFTMLSPAGEQSVQAETWWKTRIGRQMVLDELRRIGEYGIKGHLADF